MKYSQLLQKTKELISRPESYTCDYEVVTVDNIPIKWDINGAIKHVVKMNVSEDMRDESIKHMKDYLTECLDKIAKEYDALDNGGTVDDYTNSPYVKHDDVMNLFDRSIQDANFVESLKW